MIIFLHQVCALIWNIICRAKYLNQMMFCEQEWARLGQRNIVYRWRTVRYKITVSICSALSIYFKVLKTAMARIGLFMMSVVTEVNEVGDLHKDVTIAHNQVQPHGPSSSSNALHLCLDFNLLTGRFSSLCDLSDGGCCYRFMLFFVSGLSCLSVTVIIFLAPISGSSSNVS